MTNPNETINPIINITEYDCGGLTKREYFAAMAMKGLCANETTYFHDVPKLAVEFADKLIAQLNKE